MDVTFYNTATRSKDIFTPLDAGTVRMYSCGPTVYQYAHIGNLRSYVMADIVRRTLEFNGYTVDHVINITDVGHLVSDEDQGEDKVEREAARTGKQAVEIAQFYTEAFFQDLQKLGIETDRTRFPRASEHIPEQIALIQKLEEKGYTYTTEDGVYFDTSKYPEYASFAQLDVEGLQEGARVDAHTEKRNPTDFALWKLSPEGGNRQQEWDSPWGVGFPGWHIECSAMSMKYLGEEFDIHTGGIDHIPVHHTNEIAQSKCATEKNFARYWIHNEFVTIEDGKMAKSEGNFLTLDTLTERGFSPLAYRYFLLLAHYRTPVQFSWEAVEAASAALSRIYNFVLEVGPERGTEIASYVDRLRAAVNDNANTPEALAILWDLLKNTDVKNADKRATLAVFDSVLGLGFTAIEETVSDLRQQVASLIAERESARTEKDWEKADELRDKVNNILDPNGFELEDGPHGAQIRKK